MAGTFFATFRSRGPQPRPAEARKINRSRDCCVPRRLRTHYKETYGLIVLCLSPTDVCSFFVRSCRGGTGFPGRLMPARHLLFCATKKGDKKVAGNAIPRSRLPSERKIAHSRAGSLYPINEMNRRERPGIFNCTVIYPHSGQPGAPPAKGCNTREARSCPRWLRALTCKLKGQLKYKFPR